MNKDSLNLLMVVARYSPFVGGVETHVHEVGWRLAKRGINLTLLTTIPSFLFKSLPKEEIVEGMRIIRVQYWPANKDYHLAPEIYRVITNGHWDLMHCQGYHTFVPPLAMLAAKKVQIPYVVSFHSGGDTSRFRTAIRGAQRMALRPLLAEARRLICPSKWEAEFFRERLRLPNERFAIIPNGAHHLPTLTNSLQTIRDGTRIVSIGRLERYKGHQRVIAALPEVQKHIPNIHLRIVGVGPYEAELHKQAQKLGVVERVDIRAVPPHDQEGMASVIAQADLVTLLSEHEAQGIAVLEALALRRPVLVAGTTALQEFADRNLACAVSLDSSPTEVAMAIVRQLRKPLIPMHVELPTWDDCVADLFALYHSIVNG